MVDNLETFADRLKYLRKRAGLSLAAVAKQVEVSPQAVHKWENGGQIEGTRQISLAELFNVNASWLMFGEKPEPGLEEFEGLHPSFPYVPPSIPSPDDTGTFVPLIEAKNIPDWVLGTPTRHAGAHAGGWVACPGEHGQATFAMRVVGVSMEKHGDKISYSDGDIIFVDPDRPARSGTRVIVDWTSESAGYTSVFRELIIEENIRYLRALNPTWPDPIIRIYENRVLGTVIGKWVAE